MSPKVMLLRGDATETTWVTDCCLRSENDPRQHSQHCKPAPNQNKPIYQFLCHHSLITQLNVTYYVQSKSLEISPYVTFMIRSVFHKTYSAKIELYYLFADLFRENSKELANLEWHIKIGKR